MPAPGHLRDGSFRVMQQEASAIDILDDIKASKLLGIQDIEETRAQVQDFDDVTASYVEPVAETNTSEPSSSCRIRLRPASSDASRSQDEAVVENFKGMVDAQAAEFIVGKIPDAFLLPIGVRPQ